jgi:hypothetical protein
MEPKRRWAIRPKHQNRRVSFAPDCTVLIVLVAGLFAIHQIFTTTTMDCRLYYDWHLANHPSGESLIQIWFVVVIVLAAYFLADIIRPKPRRVAVLIRGFQFLLIASMVVVTIIQFGLLMPHAPQAEIARQTQVLLGRTPFFYVDTVWFDEGPTRNALPVRRGSHMADVSPFAVRSIDKWRHCITTPGRMFGRSQSPTRDSQNKTSRAPPVIP